MFAGKNTECVVRLVNEAVAEIGPDDLMYCAEKGLEEALVANVVIRRYTIEKGMEKLAAGKEDQKRWTSEYLRAAAIYDREILAHRKVLTTYHVFRCSRRESHTADCMCFHDNDLPRRRPLCLKGGANFVLYPLHRVELLPGHVRATTQGR